MWLSAAKWPNVQWTVFFKTWRTPFYSDTPKWNMPSEVYSYCMWFILCNFSCPRGLLNVVFMLLISINTNECTINCWQNIDIFENIVRQDNNVGKLFYFLNVMWIHLSQLSCQLLYCFQKHSFFLLKSQCDAETSLTSPPF